ncbi:unnamed protein product [Ilex paraguariensis]|uniref:Uncharacterized protein n=1 Tax=Ilex paraguariensis TaxID=185542 RepID=A0ABC8UR55_9AQUA
MALDQEYESLKLLGVALKLLGEIETELDLLKARLVRMTKQALEICQQLEFEFEKRKQRNSDMEMKEPADHELRDKIKSGLESQPEKPESKNRINNESNLGRSEGFEKMPEDLEML